jgi:PadR family transcriptional regulator, regulatory protein PadR
MTASQAKRTNPDFLNGVPEMLLLSLLARRPMYGYELVQQIRESTGGTLEFGEGCIYPILHRLEADGLLDAKRQLVGGRSRVVYRVTTQGSKRLAGSTAQWRKIVGAVGQALQGGTHGEPALA